MTPAPALARRSVCELETIGRRTGKPRPIEIWFAADPARDRVYLLSGGRDRAHWVRNIRADSKVRVRLGDRWFDGAAAEIEGGPDDGLVVVAAVLVAGSEKAAAHRLGLSHSTVKHHLANARRKVRVATTAQLVWILGPRLPQPDGAADVDGQRSS